MCEYCEKGKIIANYSLPSQSNCIFIKEKKHLFCQVGVSYIYSRINFCPMCGQKL